MPRPTAIVVTTIFEPAFLAGFLANLRQFGHDATTTLYIIIDRKTPATVSVAAQAARDEGFRVVCPSLDEQERLLKSWNAPDDFIPWNTDNRRNIGFLMALADGCEVLISIDDDNFCLNDVDFVGGHDVVGRVATEPAVTSSDPWFNICSLLSTADGPAVFPRGFPYRAQQEPRTIRLAESPTPLNVAMNAGLWLDDPDVDAIYRLCRRPKITGLSAASLVLGPDVWSPINTQNTALSRSAAETYYYVRMGFPLQGLKIDRFGDILSGYLTQKVVKHLGQGVRVGTPLLDHRRTTHNLFKDLYHELAGIVLIEELLPWLIELKLSGSQSLDAYAALADELAAAESRFRGFIWDDGGRDFLRETSSLMHIWIRLVSQL